MTYGTDNLAGINFSVADDVVTYGRMLGTSQPQFMPGQMATGTNESEWVYCLIGSGGVTASSYSCVISDAFEAVMLSNATGRFDSKIGIASCASLAGQYAWMQVFGPALIQVAVSAAANVNLYTTATAGVLDDDSTSGFPTGIIITTANGLSQSSARGVLNWPICGTPPSLDIAGDGTVTMAVNVPMTPEVYTGSGGVPPYTFTVSVGTLPAGLVLSSGGTLSGTPTVIAVTNVTLKVTDNVGATDTLPVEITVTA